MAGNQGAKIGNRNAAGPHVGHGHGHGKPFINDSYKQALGAGLIGSAVPFVTAGHAAMVRHRGLRPNHEAHMVGRALGSAAVMGTLGGIQGGAAGALSGAGLGMVGGAIYGSLDSAIGRGVGRLTNGKKLPKK